MLLSAEQLTKTYGTRSLLDGVSFYLEPGDKVGIIGVNGVPEAIVAGILVAAITKILLAVNKRRTI